MIGHSHCLGEPLGFVVNAARADRVHVAPVIFRLRVNKRIAVAFTGRCEDECRLLVFGQAERVVSPERADFQGRNRQFEVIDRACRRCEMENEIDFRVGQKNEIRDVVPNEMVFGVAG